LIHRCNYILLSQMHCVWQVVKTPTIISNNPVHPLHVLTPCFFNILMCVLIFCTIFAWNVSHSKRNWSRCGQKCILVFMWNTCNLCQILMKLEFSGQVFRKILKYQRCILVFVWGTCNFCQILMELEISRQVFRKTKNVYWSSCEIPVIFVRF
jgi:hypothetical protein